MKTKKQLTILEYELPVEIKKEKGNYLAECANWSDCYAQGETLEEAVNEISYVASGLLELYKEEGLKIPLKLKRTREEKDSFFKFNFPLLVSAS